MPRYRGSPRPPALAALCCGLGFGRRAASQSFTPICTRNLTRVCGLLADEAEAACLEYEQFSFEVSTCRPWRTVAQAACESSCGDCTVVAEALVEQCGFQLQVLGNRGQVERYCASTKESYEEYRCQAVVNVTPAECRSQEGLDCMYDCGNFAECMCRERRGSAMPDVCEGSPREDTLPELVGRNYTCGMTPDHCYHHKPTRCGKYKYCDPDYCLIRRVVCVPPEQCLQNDVCQPSTGLCFFKTRPDGYNCSDNLSYTLGDQCIAGRCIGVVDECLKHNVSCTPYTPCLVNGTCHYHTGRCTYLQLPDGTKCDDGRLYTLEDQCLAGACTGKPVDLCQERDVVCTVPSTCYDPGVCDGQTGLCSDAVAASDSRPCDDGDPSTTNDTCIDGICLGLSFGAEAPNFLTLGIGECTDREGRRMARYSGDVEDEQECMRICEEDAQCSAYSYAYPLCSIYGTVRFRAPEGRQWSFQGTGTADVPIAVEQAAVTAVGQRQSICRRRGLKADTVLIRGDAEVDDYFGWYQVFLFFMTLLCLFSCWPCLRTTWRFLSRCRKRRSADVAAPDGATVGVPVHPTKVLVAEASSSGHEQLRSAAGSGMDAPQVPLAEPGQPVEDGGKPLRSGPVAGGLPPLDESHGGAPPGDQLPGASTTGEMNRTLT